jgi:predicted kinase
MSMKNKIILVGGYCATGKSTFSRKLSELYNIPWFNKDALNEVLGDGFGNENHILLEQKASSASFLLMLHLAERLLQAGKICILESNFKSREIEQIKALLEKYHCECLTFIFKGDFDILFDRYIKRDISEKRHWVHNVTGEDNENFKSSHLYYEIGESGIGQTIFTDTTSFTGINYDELFNSAKMFIN